MKKLLIILPFLLLGVVLSAAIKPSTLFSDHMVLQRDVAIPVWGDADPGETVTIIFNKQKVKTKADANGRFMVKLKKQKAGGPYTLEIKGKNDQVVINDVYVGEVWLASGQSNMDMTVAREDRYWCGVHNEADEVANANYPLIRIFDVDFTPNNAVQRNAVGRWEVISPQTVGRYSAAAYFFARDLFKQYNIPVGVITSAFGASTAETWISKEALEAQPTLKSLLDAYQQKLSKFEADSAETMPKYREGMLSFADRMAEVRAAGGDADAVRRVRAPRNPNPEVDQHNPFVCYNGMIAPLVPYALRGAIWYQGESNGPSANEYRTIMETLVADWRARWDLGDFPFLYVQLANYGKTPMQQPVEHGSMMVVREAQFQNLSINNTAMVVAIENAKDNPGDIHPKNKQDIGRWLALAARAKAYGEDIVYSGPLYVSHQVEGQRIRLHFEHVGSGLVAQDGKLTGFAICGEDQKWVWADAVIDGNTVLVTSPDIASPVAVRYCWGTNPDASLHNHEGLWTPHFRTDNF